MPKALSDAHDRSSSQVSLDGSQQVPSWSLHRWTTHPNYPPFVPNVSIVRSKARDESLLSVHRLSIEYLRKIS